MPGQPQHGFVLMKISVRQMRADGLLKFAEPVFERPASTIPLQCGWAIEFVRLPSQDQEEVLG